MSAALRRMLIAMTIILILAAALAFAGSDNGQRFGGLPVYTICIIYAFVLNWLVYIHAISNQTEKYFDLTGAITNVTTPLIAILLSASVDTRGWLIFALIAIWAVRLGSFLYRRIQSVGHDVRFEEMKKSAPRFFVTWSLQALWVSFSLAAGLAAITAVNKQPLGVVGIIGLVVWIVGFGFEVVADRQKDAFRKDKSNKGKFIQTGLWAWSRHPNYFGEIVLWLGIAIIAAPVLTGWQWGTMISPLFVIVLLTRISGLPMLEAKADKTWGGQADYEAYKAKTPILVPKPPSG